MYISTLSRILLLTSHLSLLSLALPTNEPNNAQKEPLVRLLYEHPDGTWLENIAVRPNGELLVTHLEKPRVDLFNPFETDAKPKAVHSFTGNLGTMGIAEMAPDSFVVLVGNITLADGTTPGSWSIWNIDFNNEDDEDAEVEEITAIPETTFPNGLCNIPSPSIPNNLLYGDIGSGVIAFVDTTSASSKIVINNTLTEVAPDSVFGSTGVNGIHVVDTTLYFVNSAKGIFASVPIHSNGTPAGEAHIIQRSREPETIFYYDDFAIKDDDAYLVTGSGNSIERVGLDGTPKGRIIAGDLNSTQFAEPTSAAFGRTAKDSHILYVVTGGGLAAPVNGNITVGAQILAVDTSRWICE